MHEFFEESFDLENTFENILSIQISLNGFSFSILSPSDGKVLAVKTVPLKISSNKLIARRFKEWYQSENILQKPFQKIRLIIFSAKFTLIPKSIYSNDLKEEAAYALFKDGNQLQFAENLVKNIDAKLLFTIPEALLETINETVGECQITHPVKLLIDNFEEAENGNKLVLLFNNHDLTVVLKNETTVLFANNFKINHANDVVYFVLTALKQLGVKATNTALYYAGQSAFQNNIEENLAKHFSSIGRLAPNKANLPKEVIAENILLFL